MHALVSQIVPKITVDVYKPALSSINHYDYAGNGIQQAQVGLGGGCFYIPGNCTMRVTWKPKIVPLL